MTLYILRRPKICVLQALRALWSYRFSGGESKTGISIWAEAYLSNEGGSGTDVTGCMIVPGTCFDEHNLLPAEGVFRIPENTAKVRVRYDVILPITAIADVGEAMVIPVVLRLFPMGHRRFRFIGKRYLDVAYKARFTTGTGEIL